jgi:predicted DNA binding CopG/RHH family protein
MTKPKHNGFDAPYADLEEADIMDSIERDEFAESEPLDQIKAKWQEAVRLTLRKKPITVRIQERDIESIKAIALEQGIPYQTLVASVLHRFARGRLKDA